MKASSRSRALRAVVLALGALAACRATPARPDATAPADVRLAFVRDDRAVRTLSLTELTREIAPQEVTAFDPFYQRAKRYRAIPILPILQVGFGVASRDELAREQYVIRSSDGYTVPIDGARLLEGGAFVAIADLDVPGWEPIGNERTNPGPFYLVWTQPTQRDGATHPRPWQITTIQIARFETLFPHTVPTGAPADDPAWRGFATFRAQCVHCHAINREGGRVGPDLNVPRSIVEYRPVEQIRAFVHDPQAFRYSNMPAFPQLDAAALDDVVAYLRAMSTRQHVAGAP